MLNEFYDFIAKKINSFFQTAAADGTLLKGESFCLKLDNEEKSGILFFHVQLVMKRKIIEYRARTT